MTGTVPLKQMLPLAGMTISAFIFNTSEFMPIGLLIDISQSFSMTEAQTGTMITLYAWVVAGLSLPLMLITCNIESRRLLLGTMALFLAGQIGSGLAVFLDAVAGPYLRCLCPCCFLVYCSSYCCPACTKRATVSGIEYDYNRYVYCHDCRITYGKGYWFVFGLAHDLFMSGRYFTPVYYISNCRISPLKTKSALLYF